MNKNKVQCTVSGLWFGMTTNVRLKRIEKAGSDEAFRDSYICREARAMIKAGKTTEEIKAMADDGTLQSATAAIVKEPKLKKAASKRASKKAAIEAPVNIVEDIKEEADLDTDISNFLSLT